MRVLLIGSEPNGLSPPGNRHHSGSAALGTKSSQTLSAGGRRTRTFGTAPGKPGISETSRKRPGRPGSDMADATVPIKRGRSAAPIPRRTIASGLRGRNPLSPRRPPPVQGVSPPEPNHPKYATFPSAGSIRFRSICRRRFRGTESSLTLRWRGESRANSSRKWIPELAKIRIRFSEVFG